ncbi:MAG: UvrD-helicase domain-containing protein [Endomicrobium sp.]|nr:UvrD-helicase domain-containing protein [Endomicrobium sp.]
MCAGASTGTGKTTISVEWILSLIRAQGVDLKSILAISFTNRSVDMLKDRLEKLTKVRVAL